MNIWRNLILLIFSPWDGWEHIGKYNIPKDYLLGKLFGPVLGIMAVSAFVIMFYEDCSIAGLLQRAIAQVGTFYFGYMLSAYLLLTLNSEQSENTEYANKIHVFCMYVYTLLMIVAIIGNLVPPGVSDLFNIFILYVAFVIWRAKDYIGYDIQETRFVVVFILSVMAPYLLLSIVLNSLL